LTREVVEEEEEEEEESKVLASQTAADKKAYRCQFHDFQTCGIILSQLCSCPHLNTSTWIMNLSNPLPCRQP
jgi:hypothetical protein